MTLCDPLPRVVRRIILILVIAVAAAAATASVAIAHSNSCHSRHSCPSDHHSYIWYDGNGAGWDCARPGSEKLNGRENTDIVYDGRTYHCYAAGSTAPPQTPSPPSATSGRVARVVDGDTIKLRDGTTVRLVQIDTPESRGECYGTQATAVTKKLLPVGSVVRLVADSKLDNRDRYGRLLRYVFRGSTHVNLALVKSGAASPYFYGRVRGKYATALLTAAKQARAKRLGMWGACRVVWNPDGPATTRPR